MAHFGSHGGFGSLGGLFGPGEADPGAMLDFHDDAFGEDQLDDADDVAQPSTVVRAPPRPLSHTNTTAYPDDCCVVCLNGESEHANRILYCDGCNMPVHQVRGMACGTLRGADLCHAHSSTCALRSRPATECVNFLRDLGSVHAVQIRNSPKELVRGGRGWRGRASGRLTRPVMGSRAVGPECAICRRCDCGAYKRTTDARWAHVLCALWVNEVSGAPQVWSGCGADVARSPGILCGRGSNGAHRSARHA